MGAGVNAHWPDVALLVAVVWLVFELALRM
jgi:hypothetical protein